MRYAFTVFSILLLSIPAFAQQQGGGNTTQGGAPYYFHLEFEPIIGETVPGYHSFAFATYGSKWLIIGGRTNGLHGLNSNSNFETEFANNNIIVVDTTDWQWSTALLSQLPMNFADPLRSTNMQYYQLHDTLFMVGGYGWDSTNFAFVTFPTLTAIDVPGMITAVETGDSIRPHIRMYVDSLMAVSGGEMEYMNGHFYIVGGHKFEGRYSDQNTGLFTQTYTNSIRQFDIYNDIVFAPINNSELVDTNNLHRRDLNVFNFKFDSGDKLAIMGGVFKKNKNLPYTTPLYYDGQSIDSFPSYPQNFNQYTSANILVYDAQGINGTEDFLVMSMGGMSTHTYTNYQPVYDSLVPFTKNIVKYGFTTDGPQNIGYTLLNENNWAGNDRGLMPGFLGSNAIFVPDVNSPAYLPAKEAFNSPLLPFWEGEREFAGYFFGGIRGSAPNNAVSSANDTIYRVYFVGDYVGGVDEIPNNLTLKNLYPNPAGNVTTLQIDSKKAQNVIISIFGIDGTLQTLAYTGKLGIGNQSIALNTGGLAAGMYIVKIETPAGMLTKRLAVTR